MYQKVVSSTKQGLTDILCMTVWLPFFYYPFHEWIFGRFSGNHVVSWFFALLFFLPLGWVFFVPFRKGILQIISKKNWRIRIDELGLEQGSPDARLALSFNVCWKDVDEVTKEGDAEYTYYYLLLKDGNKLSLGLNCPFAMGEVIEQIEEYTENRIKIRYC